MAVAPFQLPFSAYEPHPEIPGAYNFTPSSGGSPLLAAGPEADRMRSLIDRSTPTDDRLASNAAPTASTLQPPPDATAADWIRGNADAQANAALRSQLAPAPSPVAHTAPPPAPVAAPTSAASLQRAPMPAEETAGARAEGGVGGGSLPMMRGGAGPEGAAPTTDYAMLPVQRGGGKAGYRPTSLKDVQEGGVQDPELRSATIGAYGDVVRAEADKAAASGAFYRQQVAQNDAAAKAASLEAQRSQALFDQAQARRSAAQQEYKAHLDTAQADLQAESKREVDQYRMFKGKPGAQLTAILGVALGQFGASMHGGQNVALSQLNRQIDNDVQAQREEIARGVAVKQNDITRIRDKYGVDTDAATSILNLALTDKARAQAQATAAQGNSAAAQQALMGVDASLAQRRADILDKLNTQVMGKHQVTAEERWQAAGGMDPLKLAERQDKFEAIQHHWSARRLHPELSEGEIEHGAKGGGKGSPQQAVAAAQSAAVGANVGLLGLKVDPSNPGRIVPVEGAESPSGRIGRTQQWLGEAFGTEGAQRTAQAMRDIARAGATVGRGTVDHTLYEENMKLLHKANSPQVLADTVTAIQRRASVMQQGGGAAPSPGGGYSEGDALADEEGAAHEAANE